MSTRGPPCGGEGRSVLGANGRPEPSQPIQDGSQRQGTRSMNSTRRGGLGDQKGKTMRTLTAAALGLAMTLGVASSALADCDKTIRLVASPAGKVIAADGRVRVRAKTVSPTFVKQNYVCEMSALVPNGTTFMVFNNGLPAGTITINFGVGRLALDNEAGRSEEHTSELQSP